MLAGRRLITVLDVMLRDTSGLTAAEIGRRAELEAKHAADAIKRVITVYPSYIENHNDPRGRQVRRRDGSLSPRQVYRLSPEGRDWASNAVAGYATRRTPGDRWDTKLANA